MRFEEIDLLGVYVAPLAVLLVIAYAIFFVLRLVASRRGWLEDVWHPGLFELAVYVIILSTLILAKASLGRHV